MLKYVVSCRRDGLGCRLISLFVASRFAYQYNLKHYAVWSKSRFHCHIELGEILCNNQWLHCLQEEPKFKNTKKFSATQPTIQCTDTIEKIQQEYQAVRFSVMSPVVLAGEDEAFVKHQTSNVANNYLEWNWHIVQSVQRFTQCEQLSDVTAVHIRRGDLVKTKTGHKKRLIPMQIYFQYLDDNLSVGRFMVFTENDQVKLEFKQRYGKRVLTYPVTAYGRGVNAVKQSVVELILMSHCKHIIAGRSAFNRAASIMGNTPLTAMLYDWQANKVYIDNLM